MHATHERDITLFGGECVAPGYRGRRHPPQIAKATRRRIAIAVAAALIGFATAATAISVRHSDHTGRSISAGYNLTSGVPGSVGFEAALY